MKLALLSLAAVVGAIAPRERPPQNTNPVQTPGAPTPTNTLTILPIVSFTPFPDSSSTDKITIPILSSDPTHTTHTLWGFPNLYRIHNVNKSSPPTSESSPLPTSTSSTPEGSSSSSSNQSTSSGTTTHNSTTSSATGTGTGTGTSGSTSSSRTSSSPSSSPSNAAAAVATANIMAGIAAIAGLVMVA
ncbi:hypothetical protein CCM_01111 [Cordyceps militaris CM01]|uniref:Uncharacterized protein n=1 Tax=Cordyceps militaris (strain CM01) TaxID=983644 RepID=G3J374_CORMM|nr:uncharacterized protein CCM_01111 [Cordyceps militaris CM01]EGX96455.1 hypothetical protein CCM_01111 [Cordyceps militaris CM01]